MYYVTEYDIKINNSPEKWKKIRGRLEWGIVI